ncbi:MAG TPA: GGDEF domain-containing protein [Actinomycetales bacterium]|nr:GGDEF domain-containing protein [Actinomycetales bacterium]
MGASTPLLVAGYLLLTLGQPHRPAMLAVSVALVMVGVAQLTWADRYLSARRRGVIDVLALLAHLAAAAAVGYLDGGVASPLGLLLLGMLPVFSIMLAPRLLAATAAAVVLGYVALALTGGPSPPGYTVVYTLCFLGITAVCAHHSLGLSALRRQLVDVCRLDPLTGCLNRAGFEARFGQELARAARSGERLALVLVDLDNFKETNDTYGHAAGDELLTWTAQTLLDGVRGHDLVGRLGGDEFGVVLTVLAEEGAATASARLQERLGDRSPASVGLAVLPDDGSDAASLRRVADRRLYDDKARRGRPQVPRQAQRAAPAEVPVTMLAAPARRGTHERRRRAIEQTGRLIAANVAIGVLYVAVFTSTHRLVMLGLLLAAIALGGALALGADHLASAKRVGPLMTGSAVVGCGIVVVVTLLDGGFGSPLSIGILSPIPLVALAAPPARAMLTGGLMVGAYVAVAVLAGPAEPWVAVWHLVVFGVVSVACGTQGRAAARQRARLSHLSRTDVMTGCLNRRGFEEHVRSALARAERGGPSPTLLMIDLDKFKQVNDTYGHAAGDELLQWVARTLKSVLRAEDSVARLGGDEFAVLLSACPSAEAPVVADRLRSRLAERTSVSLGSATLGEHGDDLEALYWHADALLYAEKATREGSRRSSGVPRLRR